MAWFRAGGGNGIPTQLKDNMDAVLNKKFGTSTTYPPGEWPDDVNLLGVLEEKTTTKSAIAHLTDGADRVPVKNWQVTLPASLSGVSSLTCKQAKKNICTVLPWARDTHFWGTSWSEMVTFLNTLPAGNYSVSYDFEITAVVGDSIDVSYAPYIRADVDGTMVNITPYSTPQTDSAPTVGKTYHCQSIFGLTAATVGKIAYFYLYCGKTGAKVAEVTVKNAQIELDSAPTTYEAPEITTNIVSLGRTIYGGSVDVVNGTGTETYGKVVFDGTEGTGGTPSWTMISVTQGTMFRITVSGKATTSATNTLCSYYTPTAQAQRADGTVSGAGTNVDIIDNRFSSVDTFKAWLAENPVTLVYELATSTDFTFTPITPTPETALGINNFWADEGDSQVTYRSSGTETIIAPDLTTKSITANGTYNASSDNADGYSQVTVNVTPPAVQTVQYDNLSFDWDLYIELPDNLVSPNHSYFIDFTTETQADATGEHAIFGIKNDYYYNFVGIRYNNLRYQVGQNGGSTNILNSWDELTGRHTFLYDGAGTVYFDTDAHTYSYNSSNTTGDNIPIVIGSATATPRTGKTWKGLIHRFTIRNTSTNTLVADYVPAAKQSGQTIVATGLLDLVSNNFVTTPTCSVSNDE